jgi:Gram-negative bacterial TonB protein C-terminal
MKKLLFAVALLIFCLSNTNFAQTSENSHTLRGVFKNQNSEVLAGVRMVFKNSEREVLAYSDINGDFEVQLLPGRYELTVGKTISEQFIAFIDIRENGLNPNYVEFIIEIDLNSLDASCPKTVTFTKPIYPQAARAVRAMGEVVVLAKIDKTGKVVSAKAVGGHPLLRATSERAVLASTFEPSETDEREAKLTYVFLSYSKEKQNIKRYSVPCRMEIIDDSPPTIDITDTKTN